MGKLDEAIAGQSGFPRVMPGLDQPLTAPQKLACAARILDAEGVEGYALVVRLQIGQGVLLGTDAPRGVAPPCRTLRVWLRRCALRGTPLPSQSAPANSQTDH